MLRTRFWIVAVVFNLLQFAASPVSALDFSPQSPPYWPSYQGLAPQIEGKANALRVWGPSRYETNLATSFLLRGSGGFPFETPDGVGDNAATLSDSRAWWGAGLCPKAVIVVAADIPADALTASVLSDPTGLSHEPYLRRSAAADPLFDPVGGFRKVDTDFAPLIVTESARSGATHLSTPARVALQDLRAGGCRQARSAVIVGGFSAIPQGIESELLSIGYQEVFRVAGSDRYQTAAAVLSSLGTSGIPDNAETCAINQNTLKPYGKPYYGNAVVEWHESADECKLLGKTVVLADGLAGVDALAAGWWTSYWQTPIVLHNGTDSLPLATRNALLTTSIENVIILGGPERISDQIAREVATITGAAVRRVAGQDRFGTSVAMAKYLGGWWPSHTTQVAAGSMLCVVASAGRKIASSGWADALAAGPWCAASSRSVLAPQRALPPISGSQPAISSSISNSRYQSVPVLLVRGGVDDLPSAVADYLEELFPSQEVWCTSLPRSGGCLSPGFAVVFGGPSVISEALFSEISQRLGGNFDYGSDQPSANGFITALQMSPNYYEQPLSGLKACWSRGGYNGARWLTWGVGSSPRASERRDVYLTNWYLIDAQGIRATAVQGAPGCLTFAADVQSQNRLWLQSVGPYGRATVPTGFGVSSQQRMTISKPLEVSGLNAGGFQASGVSLLMDPLTGGETKLLYASGDVDAIASVFGQTATIQSWQIEVTLQRGKSFDAPDTYSAVIRLDTSLGVVTALSTGEAAFLGGNWFLRGQGEIAGATLEAGRVLGGFTLDIFPGLEGVQDDRVIWNMDGYRLR